MTVTVRRILSVIAASALAFALASPAAQAQSAVPSSSAIVAVRLIGMNDFHGNLVPPAGSSGRVTLPDGTPITAGGAAYLATHVKMLEQGRKSILLSAGDNIGASPRIRAVPRRADDRFPQRHRAGC